MRLLKMFGILLVFGIGLAIGLMMSAGAESPDWAVYPDGQYEHGFFEEVKSYNPFQTELTARPSPSDRIAETQIAVFNDKVILDIENTQWATFTDTHSMEPVIMKGANAIHIVPETEDEVQVGDICSYKSDYAEGTIIHRIVYEGKDEMGTYYVFKGDNVPTSDPGRIRFSQIQRCVVAIVY